MAILVLKLATPAVKWVKVNIFEYIMVDLKKRLPTLEVLYFFYSPTCRGKDGEASLSMKTFVVLHNKRLCRIFLTDGLFK